MEVINVPDGDSDEDKDKEERNEKEPLEDESPNVLLACSANDVQHVVQDFR